MSKYTNRITTPRQFSAVLGVSKEEFEKLLPVFSSSILEIENIKYKESLNSRKRKKSPGNQEVFESDSDKLIFILYYMKNYPSYDVMGFNFEMGRSTAENHIKTLLPVLELAEKRLEVLPKSLINTPEELAQLADNKDILVDATERAHYRHKDYETQKEHFSGKQKDHTLKNTIMSLANKKILYIGPTVSGSSHDYNLFKQEFSPNENWFEEIVIRVDLGYQGIKKDYRFGENIFIPYKKPKKSKQNPFPELTKKQKKENRAINKKRVYVENAIGGMKRFQILVIRLRNKLSYIKDIVIRLAAGLFNLKNNFVIQ